MMHDVIEKFANHNGPTTFEFEGLVEVDYLEGSIDCVVNKGKPYVNENLINLADVFELLFRDTDPSSISGEFERVRIIITQAND